MDMHLTVKTSPLGKAVYATRSIDAGTQILQFKGHFLRQHETTPQTYALQIGPDLYIGGSGECDDHVNHSCDPNAGVRILGTEAFLIAIRPIVPDEEITFDYSTIMAENDWEMTCACGQPSCRGLIRDGRHLPDPLKRRYRELGVLPDYVCGEGRFGVDAPKGLRER